jgi:hypothetical protein
LRPNFPEYIAPHALLNFVALEVIGVQRFADDNLGPTELIASSVARSFLVNSAISS